MNATILKSAGCLLTLPLLAAALVSGCKSPTIKSPPLTGNLTTYSNLKQVDEGTWRYVNRSQLAAYNKFLIKPIKVVVAEYKDRIVTPESRQKVSDYMREALIKALSDAYPIVSTAGADTAEIDLTITDAYKTANRVGLSIEGEVLDSVSAVQIVAVVRTELGKEYLGSWWESTSAKELMDTWAQRFRQGVDQAHGK